jgi:mannosyltransferase
MDSGVGPAKIRTIKNTLATRTTGGQGDSAIIDLVRTMPTILSVGQLAPFKGTHIFVAAALDIAARNPGAQAIIVGRKPDWPPDRVSYIADLERQISDAGLSSRVRFVGECENIPAIMREATVLALPIIQQETFGNVALEAMSSGLPVVTFDSGGLTELVENGVTGIVCDAPTVECLVNGIERYLLDPPARARASEASLRRFADSDSEYSRESFDRHWSSLFQERF